MEFEARLCRLEADNSRLLRQVRWLRGALLGGVGIGALALLTAGGGGAKGMELNELRIVSTEGEPVLVVTGNPANPGLAIYDAEGRTRASLTLKDGEPRLRLVDEAGKVRAVLSHSQEKGARMVLTGEGKAATLIAPDVIGITGAEGQGVFRTP